MYYIILFLAVLSLLGMAALLDPSKRRLVARAAQQDANRSGQAWPAADSIAARLLKGKRKEDKPCLTPIDCVMDKRCAGHCGCR